MNELMILSLMLDMFENLQAYISRSSRVAVAVSLFEICHWLIDGFSFIRILDHGQRQF